MAIYRPSPNPPPIEVSRFLGVNESVGETEIQPGEAIRQVNYRITQDFKPEKRSGHKTFINYSNVKNVQGMWYGQIGAKEVLLSCNDGKLYEYNFATEINTQIGLITDAKTTIFYFNSKVYFLNGTDYKEYDGTTYQDVSPYVPTVYVASPPSGGGDINEAINLLTGRKKQSFVGNGTATAYQIVETNIDADTVLITIDGVSKIENTDFTVNRTTGVITFGVAPANLANVIIEWVKVTSGNKELVTKNKYAMLFGPGNNTSVFLWGNPDEKNRRTWSGTLKANYFPVFNFTLIGSNEFAITDIVQQYDRQIIFKEDRTHYSYADVTSLGTYDYPVFDLNEQVGNVTYDGVQIIENNPVSIKGQSWWLWSATQVKDERNAQVISERIRKSLQSLDLTTAVTFDNQKEKEYWCNVGSMVYIWNYQNNTMYFYNNIQSTKFIDINGQVYYGSQGKIERFEGVNDNNVAVEAELILGFNDWGSFELRKNTREIYVSLLPASQTSITVAYRTNRLNEFKEVSKVIEYRLLDFNNIDFNNFSFLTNRNPQTFRRKVRAKKYTYIQFKFENKALNETCVLLAVKIQAEGQGVER